ncbi:ceramide kinase-like [Ylistrum balloti]|uniref:ceramide kinase-like n=1 Tax=Ylistrum balloti TaxID=509963 RepID=UPI002905DEEF|nr:ceramide kinase-like [Ylistrum balloti]
MAEDDDNATFQSTLEIHGATHQVKLTPTHIFWENIYNRQPAKCPQEEPLFRHFAHCVPVKEILCVNPTYGKSYTDDLNHDQRSHGSPVYIEMRPLKPQSFTISYFKRSSRFKWKVKTITFTSKEAYLCQQWVFRIRSAIEKLGLQRPESLLVFVNPFGGKRRGPKIYSEKVAPLFEMAGIRTDVIITQRQNHARDIIQTYDLSRVDGVICVGGDGMFAELLNGLIDRKNRELGLPQCKDQDPVSPDLRIGVIPAGSTDAVVYTTIGINDPVTSALHIIVGDNIGLDVAGVYSGDQLMRYNVTMLSYGYYGDMLKDSEKNRWMGPKRYHVSGVKKFLGNKSYEGEVSLRLSPNADSSPRDKTVCVSGCNECRLSQMREEDKVPTRHMSVLSDTDGWHRIRGKFKVLSSFTMSCRNALTPYGMAPGAHLGDGTTDLMIITECSRAKFLKHLLRCQDKNADHFDFDFVQVYRVKEFRFRSLHGQCDDMEDGNRAAGLTRTSQSQGNAFNPNISLWNCDGEILETTNLDIKIHCQLIKIFARGIEENEATVQCPSCCTSCETDS